MASTREQITESEAAVGFVGHVISKAREDWPRIYADMKDAFGSRFIVEDETMAMFDLYLAAIAQGLQAVANLFGEGQATRIRSWVYEFLRIEGWDEYAVQEVNGYSECFQDALKHIEDGRNPLAAIPTRLLQRWLKHNISHFLTTLRGTQTRVIWPTLGLATADALSAFLGYWKMISERYELIEGDLRPEGLEIIS